MSKSNELEKKLPEDSALIEFEGEVFDYVIHPDGNKELVYHGFNTVVTDFAKLVSCLVKGQSGYAGATYMAVGSGSSSWGTNSSPAPSKSDTRLVLETFRKQIAPTDIVFLDANNAVSATPTPKIQISVLFLESEANGDLREFGIFGGNATATSNSGIMINHKTHPYFNKTNSIRLQRVLRINFAVA